MAYWIWYPQDFEIDLCGKVELRRRDHGMVYPSVWRMDAPSRSVRFIKNYTLEKAGTIRIFAQGEPYCCIDGLVVPDTCETVELPAGTHELRVSVMSLYSLPALYIDGAVETDGSFLAADDHIHNVPCGWSEMFDAPEKRPEDYKLPTRRLDPVGRTKEGYWDFGKEVFGFIHFDATEDGQCIVFCGESVPECDAGMGAELWDRVKVQKGQHVCIDTRALRYLRIDGMVDENSVYVKEEYNGLRYRASFKCDDERLNKIYGVSAYTMEMCTREFFLDGLKRDRWLWAGDALESVMMNPYSYFDSATSRRTLAALRGREPFTQHINTILDYSFYWVISVWEDYFATGDSSFIASIYSKMVSMMEYTLSCCNEDGFIVGRPQDWVFVDWADMSKEGELCIEQVLLWKALDILGKCAGLLEKSGDEERFGENADTLKKKIMEVFWSEEKGTLLHQRLNGVVQGHTRYAPMFALMYGLLTPEQEQSVIQNSLLGGDAPKITTPYMRFYEMDALMRCGRCEEVLSDVKAYWGGMLDLGATTIWEQFDPEETGAEHYAMYGRPFGRSLCHCWGAGPVYLCGRYVLGVKPTKPGYAEYEVAPNLGGLKKVSGSVPTPDGDIAVEIEDGHITVVSTCNGEGTLRFNGKTTRIPRCGNGKPIVINL